MISIIVDRTYAVTNIEGDISSLPFKVSVGMPYAPLKMKLKALGWDFIPNQWETPHISLEKIGDEFLVSAKAVHTVSGEKISVTVRNPNLSEAKWQFFKKFTAEARATGWHTHLHVKEGYKQKNG